MTQIQHRFPEIDFKLDSLDDLPAKLQDLQRQGERIIPVRYDNRTAWLITGFADVAELLGNDNNVPAGPHYARELDTFGKTLLHMQGEEHRRSKASFTPLFSVGAVRRMVEASLLPLANGIIDRFADKREIDLYVAYASPYSFRVISTILGIDVPRDEEQDFIDLLVSALQTKDVDGASYEERQARAGRAVDRLNAFLSPMIEARRSNPGDDLISFLIHNKVADRSVSDSEIRDYIRHTYIAGFDTTGLQISNVMWTILAKEGLRDHLLATPAARGPVLEEAIRVSPVTGLLARTVFTPTVVAGRELEAGSTVLMGVPGANRDVNYFDLPDGLSEEKRAKPNLTFGRGTHFCLGTHLAKEELRISLELLLTRLPGLRLVDPSQKMVGSMIRHVPDMRVAFDDVLPAKSA